MLNQIYKPGDLIKLTVPDIESVLAIKVINEEVYEVLIGETIEAVQNIGGKWYCLSNSLSDDDIKLLASIINDPKNEDVAIDLWSKSQVNDLNMLRLHSLVKNTIGNIVLKTEQPNTFVAVPPSTSSSYRIRFWGT